jgi:transposase-like protein
MSQKRRRYSAEYKFKVALEASKGEKTLSELSRETGLHPNQISQWKRQLLAEGAHLFQHKHELRPTAAGTEAAELYEQIGRLKMEVEWLKKKAAPFG